MSSGLDPSPAVDGKWCLCLDSLPITDTAVQRIYLWFLCSLRVEPLEKHRFMLVFLGKNTCSSFLMEECIAEMQDFVLVSHHVLLWASITGSKGRLAVGRASGPDTAFETQHRRPPAAPGSPWKWCNGKSGFGIICGRQEGGIVVRNTDQITSFPQLWDPTWH